MTWFIVGGKGEACGQGARKDSGLRATLPSIHSFTNRLWLTGEQVVVLDLTNITIRWSSEQTEDSRAAMHQIHGRVGTRIIVETKVISLAHGMLRRYVHCSPSILGEQRNNDSMPILQG